MRSAAITNKYVHNLGINELFRRNIVELNDKNAFQQTPPALISSAFDWVDAPEGYEFWANHENNMERLHYK